MLRALRGQALLVGTVLAAAVRYVAIMLVLMMLLGHLVKFAV